MRRRSNIVVSAVLAIALVGCGSDGDARPWDRAALGAAANHVLRAVRDHDAQRVCSMFPYDLSAGVKKQDCVDTVRGYRFCAHACTADQTDFLTTPGPGHVVDAIQASNSSWVVVVQGPPNPRWRMDPSVDPPPLGPLVERAARRGFQCVQVTSERDRPLRAILDPTCIAYVQIERAIGRRPEVERVR